MHRDFFQLIGTGYAESFHQVIIAGAALAKAMIVADDDALLLNLVAEEMFLIAL